MSLKLWRCSCLAFAATGSMVAVAKPAVPAYLLSRQNEQYTCVKIAATKPQEARERLSCVKSEGWFYQIDRNRYFPGSTAKIFVGSDAAKACNKELAQYAETQLLSRCQKPDWIAKEPWPVTSDRVLDWDQAFTEASLKDSADMAEIVFRNSSSSPVSVLSAFHTLRGKPLRVHTDLTLVYNEKRYATRLVKPGETLALMVEGAFVSGDNIVSSQLVVIRHDPKFVPSRERILMTDTSGKSRFDFVWLITPEQSRKPSKYAKIGPTMLIDPLLDVNRETMIVQLVETVKKVLPKGVK